MAKIKAAVIFGGTSREHKLSLASAAEVIRNIPEDKYEVICIGITRKGRWLYFPGDVEDIPTGEWEQDPDCTSAIISPDPLHRGIILIENGEAVVRKIDVVFPVVMGKHGADGTIQGLLDLSGIPYVGCGVLAAASCMDKSHIHMVMDDYDIATAEWRIITQREISEIDERCQEIAGELGFPLIVKPAKSGTSAGTGKADDLAQLIAAVKVAFSNDNKVVVEKYVSGRKMEAAVFGYDTPFSTYIGEILDPDRVYDPTEVNQSTGDGLKIPADISDELQASIRETAVKAYKAMGCKGLARLDFFLTDGGRLLLNKIGTSPGLRKNSVFPKLMEHMGISHEDFVDMLLEQAIDNAERTY
ncbi:MAG: Vancomycin/teicoplanin A-type resistance protein VanA [Firmicutes bacterium ADurb.BinA205]|nr:MAG: Vancomycin/teicoplanin A-type resistance protein VanA [Firmicutes bacterium ADurb.BinA205]